MILYALGVSIDLTRMECKVVNITQMDLQKFSIDLTRMECKATRDP